MNDNQTITPFNSGAWREFLRHKLAHEGVLPLRLDQFGRCADCVERGLFRCDGLNNGRRTEGSQRQVHLLIARITCVDVMQRFRPRQRLQSRGQSVIWLWGFSVAGGR
jgi:hypothetical protein